MIKKFLLAAAMTVLTSGPAFAAIPLITDDTGTQGKGRFQVELSGEYGNNTEGRVTNRDSDFSAALTYGLLDPVDIVLSIPYQVWREYDSDSVSKGGGIGDLTVEAKWRIYERDGLSVALKPGFTFPTAEEGLGAGKVTCYLFLIASMEFDTRAFHVNLAYIGNDNTRDERKDIWHASVAATVDVMPRLKLVGDLGIETNPDRSSKNPPAYVLGGLIYSPRGNFDIGLGLKGGLTNAETDFAVRGGITWRF